MRPKSPQAHRQLDRVVAQATKRIGALIAAEPRPKTFKSEIGLLVEVCGHLSQIYTNMVPGRGHHGDDDDDVGGHAIGFRSDSDDEADE